MLMGDWTKVHKNDVVTQGIDDLEGGECENDRDL